MYMLFCYFVFVCICYIFYIALYIYTGKLCCLVFVAHVSSAVSERKAELGHMSLWVGWSKFQYLIAEVKLKQVYLTMALQQFVYCVSVMTILLCKGEKV